ncbi:hypothetical protein RDWZM_000312 [Blomia tropicalis]|uniref:Uncharacterized protein n=1 Tax=Blomia tropicalis TaxID=40697 RepID=A0A9Q0M9V4_BLOTA|nr:hypothetical protein RDWZM_000312 [Blomia tropicalis]
MPAKLYFHPISPPSRAVLITARHLDLDVNVKEVDLMNGETRTSEFLKMNPTHTVPTFVDEDGYILYESRAILAYLANRYGKANPTIYPTDARARAEVDKILFFDATSYYPALTKAWLPLVFHNRAPTETMIEELQEKLNLLVTLLGDKPFFNGQNATIADISIGASAIVVQSVFPKLWPEQLNAWYERLLTAVPKMAEVNNASVNKK